MRLSRTSLAPVLDTLNAAFFYRRPLPAPLARQAVVLISSRLGLPGAYAGTFALFSAEVRAGIRLFTGERATNASARHIAAQEACRALVLLHPRPAAARASLLAAQQSLRQCVGPAAPRDPLPDDGQSHWNWDYRGGTYCCGPCTVAFWRHLLVGGFDHPETRLARGLACLKAMRKADHTWRRFPFWYTLSALIEMPDLPGVRNELRFAAPRCHAAARRHPSAIYPARRAEIARRVLARL